MMGNPAAVNQLGISLLQSAMRIAAARWGALHHFLGEILRPDATFPSVMPPREPLAPGFHPVVGRELFAYTTVEFDLNTWRQDQTREWLAAAESQVDLAAFRLESQVRESMRGKAARGDVPAIPPAIVLDPGDRIYVAPLAGAMPGQAIRVRLQARDAMIRMDLELLLAKATYRECLEGAAQRAFQGVAPIVEAAIECTRHRSGPARLLIDTGQAQGYPCTVVVGIGHPAADQVREAGQNIADNLPPMDEDQDEAS